MVGCDSYTWHRKLGHINLNALKNMRDGAVIGINFKDDGTNLKNCEICCSGMQCQDGRLETMGRERRKFWRSFTQIWPVPWKTSQ